MNDENNSITVEEISEYLRLDTRRYDGRTEG